MSKTQSSSIQSSSCTTSSHTTMQEITKDYIAIYANNDHDDLPETVVGHALKGLIGDICGRVKKSEEIFDDLFRNTPDLLTIDIGTDRGIGWNALTQAVWVGNYKMAAKLINLGANPLQRIWRGSYISVFHVICSSCYEDSAKIKEVKSLIDLFISKGVDVNGSQFVDLNGLRCPSPLSKTRSIEIAEHLRSLGATE